MMVVLRPEEVIGGVTSAIAIFGVIELIEGDTKMKLRTMRAETDCPIRELPRSMSRVAIMNPSRPGPGDYSESLIW